MGRWLLLAIGLLLAGALSAAPLATATASATPSTDTVTDTATVADTATDTATVSQVPMTAATAAVDPCSSLALNPLYQRWWDAAHQRFSRFVCWPSRWVDHFFATPGENDRLSSGTRLRVTQATTWRDDHQSVSPLKVHASAVLPNLQNRVSVIFVNDEDVLEDDRRITAGQSGELAERKQNGFHSAVRWALRTSKRINLDWDVGLRSGLHGYSQLRYRWRKPASVNAWVRLSQRVYFRDPEGFSSDSLAEYNYSLSPVSSLRFATDVLISEKNQEAKIGWVLSQNASWFYRLSERAAVQYSVGTYAYTRPSWATQNYRTSLLYRRNFFRPWLFYEVEPFWEWPKAQDFGTVTGITLRLEMLLGFKQGG